MRRGNLDVFTIVALLFLFFMVANAFFGGENEVNSSSLPASGSDVQKPGEGYQAYLPMVIYTPIQPQGLGGLGKVHLRVASNSASLQANPIGDPLAFAAPYDDYVITQGLHGYSYGHMAIDLAAGEDAQIISPINGRVTALYIDQYGNPTLILENEAYQVTLMHGKYSVAEGDVVAIGDPIGKESNLGYTLDMAGRSCRGRDCGYHSHLNVFDKRIGQNVNPLHLFNPPN